MRRIILILVICFVWVSPVQALPVAGYSSLAIIGPVRTTGIAGTWYDSNPATGGTFFYADGLYTISGNGYGDSKNPEAGFGAPPPCIATALVYSAGGYASGVSYVDSRLAGAVSYGGVNGGSNVSLEGIASARSTRYFVASSEGDVTFTIPYAVLLYSWSTTNNSQASAGAMISINDAITRTFGAAGTYNGALSFTEHFMAGEMYAFFSSVSARGSADDQVPEPKTVILFAAGLLGLVAFRKKLRRG